MNTLPLNTVFDTPSFADNTQLESTGIRELTQDEIELVNGACFGDSAAAQVAGAGAVTGAAVGWASRSAGIGARLGAFAGPVGIIVGGVTGAAVGLGAYCFVMEI